METRAKIPAMFLIALLMVSTAQGDVIFVDADATGANNGSSWADAYNYLQDALVAAQYDDEIQVAQGIYTPDHGSVTTPGDRTATFQLINGVTIKGGYAGFGEPDPDTRDIELYETILSGDLDGNDVDIHYPEELADESTRAENSYHVVTGSGTDVTAILDGFTVTGGNSDGPDDTSRRGGGMYNNTGSPTVSNCTIIKNSAVSRGGGMYNYQSNPILANCTFSGNHAHHGAGMYNNSSSPLINNCTFSRHYSHGIFNRSQSSPTLTNCTFIRNERWGVRNVVYCSPRITNCMFIANSGGMINEDYSNPILTNCAFVGNYNEGGGGGGMNNQNNTNPVLINCIFVANSCKSTGGGMDNYDGAGDARPTLTNCIFWGNSDSSGMGESSQIYRGILTINNCCVQGWTGIWGGIGNFGDDPMFADTYGPDNVLGTEDDNLRLLPSSPCIDAGDNSALPPSVVTDLDGDPRIRNAIVDIGAYESPKKIFLLDTKSVIVPEGQTAIFTVALAVDPLEAIEANVTCHCGDQDITVATGGILSFDSSNYSEPQTVTLAAAEDIDYLNGETLLWISAPGFFTAGCLATEADNEPVPTILYVDNDAIDTGDNQGKSWTDAFTELQDALKIAAKYPQVKEVRVAQGFYTPAEPFSDDLEATFQLSSGTAVRGGYAGIGAPDPDARDIDTYQTILSGDLNGNDVDVNNPADLLDEPSRSENSYHVVTGSNTDATAVLDGFTIIGGYTKGEGGGMYTIDGNPTIYNCTFIYNFARGYGGAMAYRDSNPMLTNCTFISNSAGEGSGIFIYEGSLSLTNCTFSGNSANRGSGPPPGIGSPLLTGYALSNDIASVGLSGDGGGIECSHSNLVGTRCRFSSNTAGHGGAIDTYESTVKLSNCTFSGNLAEYGGGIVQNNSSFIFTNCLFSGNSGEYGGGMLTSESDVTMTNCTFTGNSSGCGAICNYSGENVLILSNCILWNGGDEIHNRNKDVFTIKVTYSNVCGSWPGEGNIDSDPLFRDADGADDIVGTEDDNLRLSTGSPCIDAGDPNYATEPNETDLNGRPRVIGGRIDMGAYEYSPPIPADVDIEPDTLNLTSKGKWMTVFIRMPEDYDVNDIDPNSVYLEGAIEAERFWLAEDNRIVIARFSREDVQAILTVGEVELRITGQFTDGTLFEGTDVIKVIDRAGGKK